ncbi:MAG: PilZ domain-containing protein [Myxococcota bacterium]
MSDAPSVLLVDDGELDDVRDLLEEIGVDYVHHRGGAIPENPAPPRALFLATTRRAMLAQPWSFPRGEGPTRIAVVTEDSNTARSMLRRIGFDFLVRRPCHPYALRLLVTRAIYAGDERRRETRSAIGCEVSYRSGLRRRTATLADLSRRGCRLLSAQPLAIGTRITVQLPAELTGTRRGLWLRAKVVREHESDENPGQRHVLGLLFESLKSAQALAIAAAVKGRARGPMVLPEDMPTAPAKRPEGSGAANPEPERPPPPLPEVTEPSRARAAHTPLAPEVAPPPPASAAIPLSGAATPEDRRKEPRALYTGEVVHLDGEAQSVLVGRDISPTGMRIEPNPTLEPGASLRLAVYASARDQPFMVRARVLRNDGPDGVAIVFDNPAAAVAERIERMVAALPAVEPLQGGESDALGAVVGQVLETEAPPAPLTPADDIDQP